MPGEKNVQQGFLNNKNLIVFCCVQHNKATPTFI